MKDKERKGGGKDLPALMVVVVGTVFVLKIVQNSFDILNQGLRNHWA